MTRLLLLAGLLAGCLLLTSCDRLEFSAEKLMNAPMLTAEQTEIRTALTNALGTDVKFKYPKAGDYRSAFVMRDLDGDRVEEAIVFYDLGMENTNVAVSVLVNTATGWSPAWTDYGKGINVDSVAFSRMVSPDREDIVIGWSQSGNNDKTVTVYSYESGTLTLNYQGEYTEMEIYDVNHDGMEELLLLRHGSSDPANIKLVAAERGELVGYPSIELASPAESFPKIQVGMLDATTEAIFVDSYDGVDAYSTSIFKCDPVTGRLVDVLSLLSEEADISFDRSQKTYCEDINNDGVMEIPYVPYNAYLPGYDGSSEDINDERYLTQYLYFNGKAFQPAWKGVVNVKSGYRFEFPSTWVDAVTVAKQQMGVTEWRFIVFDEVLEKDSQVLLTIRTYSPNQKKDTFADTQNSWVLSTRGSYEYIATIPGGVIEEALNINRVEVEKRFSQLP